MKKILALMLSLLLAQAASAEKLELLPPPSLQPTANKAVLRAVLPEVLVIGTVSPLITFLYGDDWDELLILNTGLGGDELAIQALYNGIKQAQARGKKIHMNVVGTAVSGHAMIVCAADDVSVQPGAALVFHALGEIKTFLYVFKYRNTEMNTQTAFFSLRWMAECEKKGILTKQDVQDIIGGLKITYSYIDSKHRIRSVSADYHNEPLSWVQQLCVYVSLLATLIVIIGIIKRV